MKRRKELERKNRKRRKELEEIRTRQKQSIEVREDVLRETKNEGT
jgi:hypothetical protein